MTSSGPSQSPECGNNMEIMALVKPSQMVCKVTTITFLGMKLKGDKTTRRQVADTLKALLQK